MLQIHEAIGACLGGSAVVEGSAFEDEVFAWVLLYGPAVILGAGALLKVLGRAIDAAPETGASRAVRPMLA